MQVSDGASAAATQQHSDRPATLTASELRLQRMLKTVVVGLAVLLFAGLAAIAWRVIYLASPSARQPAAAVLAVRPEQGLQLPSGAQVRSISLSGNRIAVYYQAGAGAGIAVFDLETGRMVSDFAVKPEP
jgi:Family of unknown function (DUF6476)